MLPFPHGFLGGALHHFFDDFNRADSDTVGNNWVEEIGDWDIDTNQLAARTGTSNKQLSRPASEAFGDGWAEAILVSPAGAGSQGNVLVRFDFSADSGYGVAWVSETQLSAFRRDTGTNTDIGSASGLTHLSTDVIRLEAIGNAIKVYQNGTERISTTDANYTEGRQGFRNFASGVEYVFDDFQSQEV